MWILPLVGYAGIVLGFAFLTLAIASGLYYLSELVEEHTVLARKLLTRLIYTIVAFQVLLTIVDRFPFWISLLSVGSHVVYLGNLRHFPIVKLTDPVFILSCVLVLLNHFVWFQHFSSPPARSTRPASSTTTSFYDPLPAIPTFTEISSFFGIFVWLVPFALFVSLSAGENVLPSMGSEYATGGEVRTAGVGAGLGVTGEGGRRKGRGGLVKVGVDKVREWVGETGDVMGLWKGDRSRRF